MNTLLAGDFSPHYVCRLVGEEGESWNQYDNNRGLTSLQSLTSAGQLGGVCQVFDSVSGMVDGVFTLAGMT